MHVVVRMAAVFGSNVAVTLWCTVPQESVQMNKCSSRFGLGRLRQRVSGLLSTGVRSTPLHVVERMAAVFCNHVAVT